MGKKSITEVIIELTGQTPVQYSGELKAIKCPWHDDKKPSLVIYERTSSWFCYPCSQGSDIYGFVARYKGISYKAAKEFIDGNNDVLEEITQTLDGLHTIDEVSYNDELNIKVSQMCRDIMYRRPELVNNVMSYLRKFDERLKIGIKYDILNSTLEEVRNLEK